MVAGAVRRSRGTFDTSRLVTRFHRELAGRRRTDARTIVRKEGPEPDRTGLCSVAWIETPEYGSTWPLSVIVVVVQLPSTSSPKSELSIKVS